MCDPHVHVVSHNAQVIGGLPVGAQQYKVLDLLVLNRDPPENLVFKISIAGFGNAEADHVRNAFGQAFLPFRLGKIPAGPVVFPGPASGGERALGLQLFRGAEAGVGVPRAFKLRRHRAIAVQPVGLVKWPFVPVESQPLHALQDRRRQFRPGAVGIGVLNPQNKDAVHASREQPVVESGACSTDVQVAGG